MKRYYKLTYFHDNYDDFSYDKYQFCYVTISPENEHILRFIDHLNDWSPGTPNSTGNSIVCEDITNLIRPLKDASSPDAKIYLLEMESHTGIKDIQPMNLDRYVQGTPETVQQTYTNGFFQLTEIMFDDIPSEVLTLWTHVKTKIEHEDDDIDKIQEQVLKLQNILAKLQAEIGKCRQRKTTHIKEIIESVQNLTKCPRCHQSGNHWRETDHGGRYECT